MWNYNDYAQDSPFAVDSYFTKYTDFIFQTKVTSDRLTCGIVMHSIEVNYNYRENRKEVTHSDLEFATCAMPICPSLDNQVWYRGHRPTSSLSWIGVGLT
jgi:hypothetical protein